MIPEAEAVEFVDTMSRVTGINVAFGLNAYYGEPEFGSGFVVTIDPTGFDDASERRLESYVDRKGFRLDEFWNDWGRFLRIYKIRLLITPTSSP